MGEEVDVRLSRMNPLVALWQPAGAIYLCFCLAGLAAGLWHGKIVPSFSHAQEITLPTLQTLAVAQVFFFLLAYPIILMRRGERRGNSEPGTRNSDYSSRDTNSESRNTTSALRTSHSALLIEFVGMFLVTTPLYFLAAWLGDVTGRDVLRTILAVAAICPFGVLAGRLLARPIWRGGVMLLLLVIVLGLPGAWYICADLLNVSGDWALQLSPALQAWQSAAARQTAWLPQPTWAWLLWPILSAAGGLCLWALPSRKAESNRS